MSTLINFKMMTTGAHNMETTNQLKESAGYHRWIVVLSACVVMINGFGLISSIGRFFVVVMNTFKTSRAEVALIQALAAGTMGIAGVFTGSLVHKYQPRICGIIGASMTTLGLCLCFFAKTVVYLYVGMGFMFGVSFMTISSTTMIGLYFEGKLRLIVLSLTAITGALGGMAWPYLIVFLYELYGLHGALLIIGVITSHSFAASLLWKHPVTTIEEVEIPNINMVKNKTDNITIISSFPDSSKSKGKEATSTTDMFKALFSNNMFVAFTIAATCMNVSFNVFLYLLVDIFRDKGFITDETSLAMLLTSLFHILGLVSFRTLTIIPHVTVLTISIVGACVLAILHVSMIYVKSLTLTLFLTSLFGVCKGIGRAQFTVTISQLLDSQHLSIGMGIVFTMYGCVNTFTGPLCGFARDQMGSYTPIFLGAAIVSGTGCCLFGAAEYFNSRKKGT